MPYSEIIISSLRVSVVQDKSRQMSENEEVVAAQSRLKPRISWYVGLEKLAPTFQSEVCTIDAYDILMITRHNEHEIHKNARGIKIKHSRTVWNCTETLNVDSDQ